MENFELFRKVPKPTVILSGFLEMRREGFIPHREYYCLLIPCLVAFADHQGKNLYFSRSSDKSTRFLRNLKLLLILTDISY